MAIRVYLRRTLRTARFVASMVCALQGLRFAPWAVAA